MRLGYLALFAIGAVVEFLGIWMKEYASKQIKEVPKEPT